MPVPPLPTQILVECSPALPFAPQFTSPPPRPQGRPNPCMPLLLVHALITLVICAHVTSWRCLVTSGRPGPKLAPWCPWEAGNDLGHQQTWRRTSWGTRQPEFVICAVLQAKLMSTTTFLLSDTSGLAWRWKEWWVLSVFPFLVSVFVQGCVDESTVGGLTVHIATFIITGGFCHSKQVFSDYPTRQCVESVCHACSTFVIDIFFCSIVSFVLGHTIPFVRLSFCYWATFFYLTRNILLDTYVRFISATYVWIGTHFVSVSWLSSNCFVTY